MLRTFIFTAVFALFSFSVSAGCMTSKITDLETKLKESNLSAEKKQEVEDLIVLVRANEHEDGDKAEQHYKDALGILN